MSDLDLTEVRRQAQLELRQENFRAAVDQEKEKIRLRGTFWSRIFPYTIIILKKEKSWVK